MSTIVACSSPEEKKQISSLVSQNDSIKFEIKTLQKKLDSIQLQTDSLHKILLDLDLTK